MDFDTDGLLDLVAGDASGNVWFFKNVGTKTAPKLAAGVKVKADGKEITGSATTTTSNLSTLLSRATSDPIGGVYSKLHVTDWDGDGKLDILVGHTKSSREELVVYKNIGTAPAPKFAASAKLDNSDLDKVSRPSPYVVDWDGDGKRDMLVGTDDGKVLFLRNVGSNAKSVFAKPEQLKLPGLTECIRARICVVDWKDRGKLDLLVGTYYSNAGPDKKATGGNVWLFQRK